MKTWKKRTLIGGGILAGTILTGGLAWTFAPVIAAAAGSAGLLGATATAGTTISSLTGIALSNASLAALGGGALSVGGAGMAGGTVVITAVGTGAGAVISTAGAVVVNA